LILFRRSMAVAAILTSLVADVEDINY